MGHQAVNKIAAPTKALNQVETEHARGVPVVRSDVPHLMMTVPTRRIRCNPRKLETKMSDGKVEIAEQRTSVLNDVIPGIGKVRVMVCELFAKDGRSGIGISPNFVKREAFTNAYEMLLNKPIIGGKVATP